ncbi:hypothetical protein L1887_35907 [Cichorium endivia]|nr:hypothetical protein L1887_35907 [Cichorium endivia]
MEPIVKVEELIVKVEVLFQLMFCFGFMTLNLAIPHHLFQVFVFLLFFLLVIFVMCPLGFVGELHQCSTSSAAHMDRVSQIDVDVPAGNPVYFDCGDPVHIRCLFIYN